MWSYYDTGIKMKCNKCGKEYHDAFDSILRLDYLEPGKGKPYTWHLCMNCRKKLINYINVDEDKEFEDFIHEQNKRLQEWAEDCSKRARKII